MKTLTEDQQHKLLIEARKVRQPDMSKEELMEGLCYLSQICLVDYDMDWLDFCVVKDNNGKKHIRCFYGEKEYTILDNAVEKYSMDSPEDMVYVIKSLYDKKKSMTKKTFTKEEVKEILYNVFETYDIQDTEKYSMNFEKRLNDQGLNGNNGDNVEKIDDFHEAEIENFI